MVLTVFAFLVLICALYGMLTYNRFIGLQQRADNAFSDVDVQLKRRWDLVPPLVETVRGFAGHEQEVLNEVVAARSRAMTAGQDSRDAGQRGASEADLARALRGIFVLIEDYPALKANNNFLELHKALVTIEDDIQYARRYHNAVVRDINTLRQRIPSSIVGSVGGISLRDFFQLENNERSVPSLDLGPREDPTPEISS